MADLAQDVPFHLAVHPVEEAASANRFSYRMR